MKDGLYHRDVYLPSELVSDTPRIDCTIRYTDHAIRRMKQKHIHRLHWFWDVEVVEIEYKNNRIRKVVYRMWYDDTRDMCMVFNLRRNKPVCVTCWLNDRTDTHETLDKRKYVGYEPGYERQSS